jgi:hypothetical protein
MHRWQEGIFLYWFAGLRPMSLCFCPLIFTSNAGHMTQNEGLKDQTTCSSTAIKCPHKMLKSSAYEEFAAEN